MIGKLLTIFSRNVIVCCILHWRKRLIAFGGNASEAFAEPFYKPKSNGLRGPLVKSVPIIQRPRSFVRVRGGIGINGDMIRIDVFRTADQAYYFVPIYVKDTLQDALPLRAATKIRIVCY